MIDFLHGVVALGAATIGLFFARFYRQTRDRLFVFLALAFFILGVHWTTLSILSSRMETRHWLFLPRLAAFVLIIIGILDKNRRC
jgi:hypothetical protein